MAPALIDSFGRKIEYLRVSVTDRCDLRCQYCIPEAFTDFSEPNHWLTFEEITRVIRLFAQLGTRRIRITGGEPLVRKNLPTLIQALGKIPGVDDLSLSTNAVRLKPYAKRLHEAGISRLNVSLDTLDAAKFKRITKGLLHKVTTSLETAKAVGFSPIKINMVLLADTNLDDILDMVSYCAERDFTLRMIETMPLGSSGQNAYLKSSLSVSDIKQKLAEQYTLLPSTMPGGGPARYFKIAGSETKIGFITPITQHFCATCNRVRLSVDGTIYTCLGQENNLPLRPLLRSGASDAAIIGAIETVIQEKPERHEFTEKPLKLTRIMSATGG